MFTGLVEGLGEIVSVTAEAAGRRISVRPPECMRADPSKLGDSVAINGCCLTIVDITAGLWTFQAGPETLLRTNLGDLIPGSMVNLERALPANARLGGHFVQGHIDGRGEVSAIRNVDEWIYLEFRVPVALTDCMVSKGSIAVDGVSLTLVDVQADHFSVMLIPHTLAVTTLGRRAVGDAVNIETDILGKYVHKLLNGTR